jgi:hypothetical protein
MNEKRQQADQAQSEEDRPLRPGQDAASMPLCAQDEIALDNQQHDAAGALVNTSSAIFTSPRRTAGLVLSITAGQGDGQKGAGGVASQRR